MRRWRFLLVGAAAVLAAALLAAGWGARRVERRLGVELQKANASLGLSAGAVHFSWWGPLRLEGVRLAGAGPRALTAEAIEVSWSVAGGSDPRSHVRGLRVRGLRAAPGALTFEWPEVALEVLEWTRGEGRERVRLRQAGGSGEAEAVWGLRPPTSTLTLSGLDLSAARLSWRGEAILDPGRWSGRLTLAGRGERLESGGDLTAEGVRVALPRTPGLGTGDYGSPSAAALGWDVLRERDSIEVRHASARMGGVEVDGHGRWRGQGTPQVELVLSARTDLGTALRTTGLALPASLPAVPGSHLGSASFDVSLRGPLGDPAALRIAPRLRFESAPEAVGAFQFLRQPFRYTPDESAGHTILVGPGASTFVALPDVPPFFVHAVLVSEDAGFFGHPGIDVAEIPVAWATNEEEGTAARGASTITQQLVKNLFLHKDKSYGRKLTEAALALMMDAALPKPRILEIYLNVIEWGPGLYGLGPATQHYFGKTPGQLTAKETAFLVCLIPSPVRYHQAHVAGHAGPGMEQLMANLLTKLHAAGDLSDDEYDAALAEELVFRPENETAGG